MLALLSMAVQLRAGGALAASRKLLCYVRISACNLVWQTVHVWGIYDTNFRAIFFGSKILRSSSLFCLQFRRFKESCAFLRLLFLLAFFKIAPRIDSFVPPSLQTKHHWLSDDIIYTIRSTLSGHILTFHCFASSSSRFRLARASSFAYIPVCFGQSVTSRLYDVSRTIPRLSDYDTK